MMMERKNDNQNISVYNDVDSDFNIQAILFKYLAYWKWFVLSIFIFVIIGVITYMRADRQYIVSMAVFIKEGSGSSSGSSGTPLSSLQDLGLVSTTNNINNEIVMLSSPSLMRQVVHALELQTSYYRKGSFRDAEIYTDCPYYVYLEGVNPDSLSSFIKLNIESLDQGCSIEGILYSPNGEFVIESEISNFPGYLDLPDGQGKLYIALRKSGRDTGVAKTGGIAGDQYIVTIQDARGASNSLTGALSVKSYLDDSSALGLTMTVSNTKKGKDVLAQLIIKYNEENIRENNQTAGRTSVFIDERLDEIGKELSRIEQKIESYKKTQGIVDLASETQLFMQQSTELDKRRIEVETQLNVINMVGDFIKNPNNKYKLIPSLDITDPGLATIILEYNNLVIKHGILFNNANTSTPSLTRTEESLSNMREQIINSVANVKESVLISKKDLEKQRNVTSSRIHSIPVQERDLLELMRQQQINQTLYVFLLQTRIETNITMASSSNKAKVIDEPSGSGAPISPKGSITFAVAFLIGLFVPIIIIFLKDYLKIHVNNLEDLEKMTSMSVLGEIPRSEEKSPIVVLPNRTDPTTELFRSLRNNVRFLLDDSDKKVILVTSTIPNEGKTFIGVNLAASYAFSSNRVLLIGMDLRNPQLANTIGVKKERGVSEFLSGQEADWKKLVRVADVHPNLEILQAGTIPPNPNELLIRPQLKQMMTEAREIYDIIIIDSAPLGIISDTFLLKKIPDVTLCVVREGVTPKDAVNFLNSVHSEGRMSNMYLVLNDANIDNSNKYGKYNYKYTYGYGNNNK